MFKRWLPFNNKSFFFVVSKVMIFFMIKWINSEKKAQFFPQSLKCSAHSLQVLFCWCFTSDLCLRILCLKSIVFPR